MNTREHPKTVTAESAHIRVWNSYKNTAEERFNKVLSGGNTPIEVVDILAKTTVDTPEDAVSIVAYLINNNATNRDISDALCALTMWVRAYYEIEYAKEV